MQAISLQQADLIRLLQGKHMRWLILVVNLLLVIWIASVLAKVTWGLLDPSTPPPGPVVGVSPEAPLTANRDRQLISQMPGWHLLGTVPRGAAPAKTNTPVDAPDTTLQLVLRGLLASDSPAIARAIIADPRGKEDQYAVGESIAGKAELSEIHADRVILKRNGRFETLRLPQGKNPRNVAKRQSARPPARSTRSRQSASQRLKAVRQQLKQNPQTLASLVRATPKRGANGKTVGYVLSPGRDPEFYNLLGLQRGDVVTEVNNIKLDNPVNSARALKSVQSGDTVTMTVLRKGQPQVINLSVPE